MYFFELSPKPQTRRMYDRPLEPRDVWRHVREAGVHNDRFTVLQVGQTFRVECLSRQLIDLLHDRLRRLYYVDPVQQKGFERRRQHIGA